MSEPATISALAGQGNEPASAGGEDAVRGLIGRQLAVLGRLAEAGLNIALAVERQAMAAEGAASGAPSGAAQAAPADVALAYGRVARAVRLTVALQARLVKDLQALDEGAARRRIRDAAEAGRDRQTAEAARKARVERIVERLIRAEASDEAEGDRLADEAFERLEHDDIYGDLSARPVSEIIALVCRDLGLAPDWSRLAEEAWAQEELASGAAGPPLTAIRWLEPPPAGSFAADPPPRELRGASP